MFSVVVNLISLFFGTVFVPNIRKPKSLFERHIGFEYVKVHIITSGYVADLEQKV